MTEKDLPLQQREPLDLTLSYMFCVPLILELLIFLVFVLVLVADFSTATAWILTAGSVAYVLALIAVTFVLAYRKKVHIVVFVVASVIGVPALLLTFVLAMLI